MIATIYIDDVIMGGPLADATRYMAELQKHVKMKPDDGASLRRILGIAFTTTMRGTRVMVTLCMEQYTEAMVHEYKTLAKIPASHGLRSEKTPAYAEDYRGLDKYENKPSELEEHARKIVGKALYLGRALRADALFTICLIARRVHIWDMRAEMMLHKLMCYLWHTRNATLQWVFDQAIDLKNLRIYGQCDSDHGGCELTARSTGGELLWLLNYQDKNDPAPTTSALFDWKCSRQDTASSNTAESELAAAHALITKTLLPAASVLQQALPKCPELRFDVDNDACRTMILKGMSPSPRHVRKHKRISIAATHSLCQSCGIIVGRIPSEWNTSDILTKPLKEEAHVRHFRGLGLIFPGGRKL